MHWQAQTMNSKTFVPRETVFDRTTDPQATNMFLRPAHGITYQHHYPTAPAESRDQSFEPYPSVSSYPESSQRTQMHHEPFQFRHIHGEEKPHGRVRSYIMPSGAFSSPPIPSDRPPPSLRLPSPPSFSGLTYPSFDSYSATQSPSSSRAGAVNYRRLSLSLSDSEDDVGCDSPHRDFIPIVPKSTEASTSFHNGDEFDDPSSGISTPNSASELSASPRISIETIPSRVEHREGSRRKGPEKMHRCEICDKEFPRPSAVKTHMNVHNNARPYPCGFPNCPKTFSVRSNARRHYRTHGEKPPLPTSPLPSQAGFQFAELIDAPPQPRPPPRSLSQAPFRVRWVATNTTTRNKMAPPRKQLEKKSSASTDNLDELPPMFLHDPFLTPAHQVRDMP
ncbi:hypothetical protein K438DRAFT_297496 [Mycena galopus ATCC 62051]|nr:hypothetical protein K438DRAFT_297496 [Mycena galopus ATCC 62051]